MSKKNKDETLSLADDFNAVRDQSIPRQIGPYRIIKKLGEGGFGVVYLARQEEPVRRSVAIKILQFGRDSQNVVTRFKAEQQALAIMNHENIARVFDAGVTDSGQPYFVMEYVEGIQIKDFCDREKLTIRDRLGLFISVCEGIQHAHQKGIIHRDLKPSNVIVSKQEANPVPKIIDFGIAKAMGDDLIEDSIKTQMGFIIGTPAYMSPEQMEGAGVVLDTRSDIYSLGVMLYELLVDSPPFDIEKMKEEVRSRFAAFIREETPFKPSDRLAETNRTKSTVAEYRKTEGSVLVKQIRGDLDWIVLKALEKSPEHRYASASEFASDIRRHLDDQPVVAGPPSTIYRLKKFVRRHKLGVIAAAAIATTLVAGVTGLT
ncbi:serine/threonine protein kinase, partial [Acidobacteriota bacterium]